MPTPPHVVFVPFPYVKGLVEPTQLGHHDEWDGQQSNTANDAKEQD